MTKNKIIPFIVLLSIFIYTPKVNAMAIFIKKPSEETVKIEVESSDTIDAVKEKIYLVDNGFPPQNQRLVFNDKEMENGRTLSDYNVQKETTINLYWSNNNQQIKVIFDANGGTFENGTTYTIDNWNASLYDNLVTPTKNGYKFKGYFTEKTGGTKFEMILNESGIDSDMTFYAQWEENSAANQPISEVFENPKTGDNIIIYIIMLVISSTGMFITSYFIKEQKTKI